MPDLSTRKWATDFRRAWHSYGLSIVLVEWTERRCRYEIARWVTSGATFVVISWSRFSGPVYAYRSDREGD
jgi:hypothetical protein